MREESAVAPSLLKRAGCPGNRIADSTVGITAWQVVQSRTIDCRKGNSAAPASSTIFCRTQTPPQNQRIRFLTSLSTGCEGSLAAENAQKH